MSHDAGGQPALIGLAAKLMWASGSFGTGALFNAMALFALFYMTNFLGLSPALSGTILLVARVYDGVIDPLIGAVSDRTRHRWGPRRLYLLIGALALGGSFALFFNLARLGVDGAASALLVTAALLLYSTAYSLFTIPYLAMPPDIAPDYQARTKLMSYRVFFLLAGVMAGSAGAPVLIKLSGGCACWCFWGPPACRSRRVCSASRRSTRWRCWPVRSPIWRRCWAMRHSACSRW